MNRVEAVGVHVIRKPAGAADAGDEYRLLARDTNAGEGYDTETLVLATVDKLSSIGSVTAKSEVDCRRSTSEEATISIAPDYGPFARITGYVKTSTRRVADDCKTPQGREMITIDRIEWRWSAARQGYRKLTR